MEEKNFTQNAGRKAYSSPEIRKWGTVADLTKSGMSEQGFGNGNGNAYGKGNGNGPKGKLGSLVGDRILG